MEVTGFSKEEGVANLDAGIININLENLVCSVNVCVYGKAL